MDQQEILKKLKALNSAIEDYLDRVDIDDADCGKKNPEKED